MIPPLHWLDDEFAVSLLDQTALPEQENWLRIETPEAMAFAIRSLAVRGAPAIGIAAAFGVALALRDQEERPARELLEHVSGSMDLLAATRPTAANMSYARGLMRQVLVAWEGVGFEGGTALLRARHLKEAPSVGAEDQDAGRRLGEFGIESLGDASTILTHCHTGGVATPGYGTALAPIILAKERGRPLRAFVDETRPLLQGSRITAWELMKAGVDATLITDSMAAHVMQQGLVDAVIVGADRIAANGDVANKIGTYGLAVLADAHGIPFYVSAPVSTIDLGTASGQDIVIEERDAEEVRRGFGKLTAPAGVDVYNPAFDVTPAELVDAIITERGVIRAPYGQSLRMVCESTLPARAWRNVRRRYGYFVIFEIPSTESIK